MELNTCGVLFNVLLTGVRQFNAGPNVRAPTSGFESRLSTFVIRRDAFRPIDRRVAARLKRVIIVETYTAHSC